MPRQFTIYMSRKLADDLEAYIGSQSAGERRLLDDAFRDWHHLFADEAGVNPQIRYDEHPPPLATNCAILELLVNQKLFVGMRVDYLQMRVRVDFMKVV